MRAGSWSVVPSGGTSPPETASFRMPHCAFHLSATPPFQPRPLWPSLRRPIARVALPGEPPLWEAIRAPHPQLQGSLRCYREKPEPILRKVPMWSLRRVSRIGRVSGACGSGNHDPVPSACGQRRATENFARVGHRRVLENSFITRPGQPTAQGRIVVCSTARISSGWRP